MFLKIKKLLLPIIITISALAVSSSAAFYSVTGLSQLFAGASFEVMVMAGSLEVSKLVIASLLYQYWSKLNIILKSYLTGACIILILITSMGIYGFLSGAYQVSSAKLDNINNKTDFNKQKIELFSQDLQRHNQQLSQINQNITNLSQAKSRSIQVRDTTTSTGYRNTISNSELRLAQKRIKVEDKNREKVNKKINRTRDSISKYKTNLLKIKTNSSLSRELGPLQFVSQTINKPMDYTVNILILMLVFVFDPLAVSLVIAANFAFKQLHTAQPKTKQPKKPIPNTETKEFTSNSPKPPEDRVIKEGETPPKPKQTKISELNNKLKENLSVWKKNKIKNKIEKLKNKNIPPDDTEKIY